MEWENSEDSELLNGARLMHHVAEKGFQAGSLIGIAIVVPIIAYRSRGAVSAPLLLNTLGKSALYGTAITTTMGIGKIYSIPADERSTGLQDRAYRLHFNQGQKRCDLFSEIGMALGGTAASAFVSPAFFVGGAAAGSAVGVLAHVVTQSILTKKEES